MSLPKARPLQRLRWILLEHIYQNHRAQGHRYDFLALLEIAQSHGYVQLGSDDIIALLQDLKERQLIRYQEQRDSRRGLLGLSQIEISMKGQQYFEAREDDPRLHYVE